MNGITLDKYVGFNHAMAAAYVAKIDAGETPILSYGRDASGKVQFWCLPEELDLVVKACNHPSA